MSKQSNPEAMKWPTDKPRYDKNYLRLYGKQCPVCDGNGKILKAYSMTAILEETCSKCKGLGKVEK